MGWTHWYGGEKPPVKGKVHVVTRVGMKDTADASEFRWTWLGQDGDIVSYFPKPEFPGLRDSQATKSTVQEPSNG